MSRRSSASPEEIFAKRRGETPYQIYFEISNIGRNVESSKKRARWKFCFGDEGRELEVVLVHSLMSGKKRTFFNGECINEAQKVAKEWSFAWSFGAHLLRVGINFEEYNLVVDGIPFRNFSRRDPYLAAQLEATKRDSMRSLQTDEQRRFEKLGYGGGGNSSARSKAELRRRPSQNSAGSGGGSRSNSVSRAVSSSRSRAGDRDPSLGPRRRSSSVESSRNSGGDRERRQSPIARSSSTRRMQSAPDDRRGSTGSTKPRVPSRSRSSASVNGSSAGKGPTANAAGAAATASRSPDILSADPSSLEVKGFDMTVPESSFDPLGAKFAAAAAASGCGTANGGTGVQGGGGGGYEGQASGYGHAGGVGYGGGRQEDAQAVLQLGMEFGAMEMNAQMQQQPQYMQQPAQQQNFFGQESYQQYDGFGFPLASQTQTYNNPPPQHQQGQQQQQPHQHGSGFPGGNGVGGGASFPVEYAGQGQGQSMGGAQQGYATGAPAPPASAVTDLVIKSSNDPWDAARAGMVNIDDITDTKHKPMVEVKPFTNDHRPLADLVREAPKKEKKAVMIDRPPPQPTHIAVAIVPVQPQQMGYQQGGHPQHQNGNPFNQPLQLTQYGNQAQPILYTKPEDPFYNL